MSWPVAGTMMIEPTESEGLQEIDRFCNTLKKIKEEIDKVKSGEYDKIDNPIKNSPHTHVELIANKWEHKYERIATLSSCLKIQSSNVIFISLLLTGTNKTYSNLNAGP